jgi:hypothetical protein
LSIKNTDIEFRLSGSANNGDPFKSLGGPMSMVAFGNATKLSGVMGALFDFVPLSEAITGLPAEYRCLYVRNANLNGATLVGAKLWFEYLNVDIPDIINTIGLDPAGINGVAQVIATETTAPLNVVFSQPLVRSVSFHLGDLKAGNFYPFWIKRVIKANASPYYQDTFVLRVEGEPAATAIPPPPPGSGSPPPPPGSGGGPPPPGPSSDFGFAAAGNWSCASSNALINMKNIIIRLVSVPPLKLFFALGDLAYNKDPSCWFNMTSLINNKTHIILGNTEMDTEVGKQPALKNAYMNHYGLTLPYYSFDFQDVHFLVLCTEIPYNSASMQYKFAAADLLKASTNSATDWIVVCYHQPMYTSGGTGDMNNFDHLTWASTYGPLFDNFKVDLALSDHCHNFQRTYPIKYNTVTPTSPTIAVTGTNDYTDPDGTIYVIAGTGGKSHDKDDLSNHPSYFAYTNSTDFGYVYITISNSGTLLKGNFYNLSNNSLDSFSISKS